MANAASRLRAEFCSTPPSPSECPCYGFNALIAMQRQVCDYFRASAGCTLVTQPLAEERSASLLPQVLGNAKQRSTERRVVKMRNKSQRAR